MPLEDIRLKLEPLIQKCVESQGFELIELNVKGHKNDVKIEVTADKPNGGISIEECAIINKSLVAAIEQEGLLPLESFSLELSSPGLDRALVTQKDFMRVRGQKLHFWLKETVAGKREIQGILEKVNEDELVVSIPKKTDIILPLSSINKGLLVINT